MLSNIIAIASLAAIGAVVVAWLKAQHPVQRANLRLSWEWAFRHLGAELGAVTLAQAATLSETDLQQGIVETFIIESVVLDRIPFISTQGTAFAYNAEATLPGVEFRAVNAAYTESTGTVTQATETLVILGGDADVDTFIQATRSNLNDQRAVQEKLKVKAAVYKFQDTFLNGDTAVDANSFDGLKKRLTGAQVIDAATNGLAIIGADDAARHAFLDKLDELLAAVDGQPDALYMNAGIRAKIKSSARRLGGWDMSRDDFGKTIETYNGIPLFNIGKTAAGVDVIPQTEVQGSSGATATSIYAVRFGEDPEAGGVTALTPNADNPIDVRDLGEIDSKPVFRTRIEAFIGLAVFGKSAARLRGVLAS